MAKVMLSGWQCERCGHIWLPTSQEEPRVCPRCKSPYWNKPRVRARPGEKAEATPKTEKPATKKAKK